jgi:peptidoglycan/LPS O-acetylase OafA/YrhL
MVPTVRGPKGPDTDARHEALPVRPQIELPPRFPASAGRIAALDGLRGLAILFVLLWHGLFSIPFRSKFLSNLIVVGQLSWSGVDLFFVLSGFLIGGILLDTKNSPRYFTTFYIRRAYRILPLYAAVIGLYLLWPVPFHLLPDRLGVFLPSRIPLLAYLTFTQNLWMAHLGTFDVVPTGVTWSLAVEEQFYLTVPLLVWKINRSRLAWTLIAVVIGVPLLRVLISYSLKEGNFADYVLMPCRADALCLGVLSALLVRTPRFWNALIAKRLFLYPMAGIALIGLIWFTYKRYDPYGHVMITAGYSLVALFYTFWLLIALTSRGVVQRILHNRALRELGTLAYCTYLLHLPFMAVCRRILGMRFDYSSRATQFFGGLIGILLTLVAARLSWRFFEQPMLRRGHSHKY